MSSVLARAEVTVGANTAAFNTAMGTLPAKARQAVQAARDAIVKEMAQVRAQIQVGVASGNVQQVKLLRDYMASLKQQLDAAKASAMGMAANLTAVAAAGRAARAATNIGAGGMRNLGYAALMVSQAVEDLQYGFAGIINNIPGIVQAMGFGPGVAAGFSLASVALNVLIKNWNTLANAFGMGHVKTQAEEMEELRKKTVLTADEAERLARAEALPAKVKEVQNAKSEDVQQTEDAVKKAVGNAGRGALERGIRDAGLATVDSTGDAAEVHAKIRKLRREREIAQGMATGRNTDPNAAIAGGLRVAAIDRQIREMTTGKQSELEQARDRTASMLAGQVFDYQNNPGRLGWAAKLAAADPKKFGSKGHQLAFDLANASPEARKLNQANERDEELNLQARESRREEYREKSTEENTALGDASERVEMAKQAVTDAVRDDPLGKSSKRLAEAERELADSLEEQRRLNDRISDRRREDLAKMSETDARPFRREEESRRDNFNRQARANDKFQDDENRNRARAAGAGLDERYRIQVLRDIGLGKEVDRKGLEGKVSGDLARSGYAAEDVARMAPVIVEDLIKQVRGKVQDTQNELGVDRRQSATIETARESDAAQRKADRGHGGFSGFEAYAQQLQMGLSKTDAYRQATAEATRSIAETDKQILAELRAANGKKNVAVAVGPA